MKKRVGGYLAVYGSVKRLDLEGEYFHADTDFDLDNGTKSVSVYFVHGLDGVLRKSRIGRARLTKDSYGVRIDATIDVNGELGQYLGLMLDDGVLGWSSGAPLHLVERKREGGATRIDTWAIAEASLTTSPVDPAAIAKVIS